MKCKITFFQSKNDYLIVLEKMNDKIGRAQKIECKAKKKNIYIYFLINTI